MNNSEVCKNYAVIGLGFGDEGKGLTTSYLCSISKNPLVVRFNGGHQAGHTVHFNNKKHTFSNFGAGTLQTVPTYWSEFCTVNIQGLLKEYRVLRKKDVFPRLHLDFKAKLTTKLDILFNQVDLQNKSTVGVGFGTTLERNEKFYTLNVSSLLSEDIYILKLNAIFDYYSKLGFTPLHKSEFISEEMDARRFLLNTPNIEFSPFLPNDGEYSLIFEGAQGILLDYEHGIFPQVTRSKTDLTNILKLEVSIDELFLVSRSYTTLHNEFIDIKLENKDQYHNPYEHNIHNAYQKRFITGQFKPELYKYALGNSGIFDYLKKYNNIPNLNLMFTCCDIEDIDTDFILTSPFDEFTEEPTKIFKSYGPSLLDIKRIK